MGLGRRGRGQAGLLRGVACDRTDNENLGVGEFEYWNDITRELF